MITADYTLDTLGLFCPIPVILTSKKMKKMAQNQVLEILSDDEGIKKDMPVWCQDSGNEFLDLIEDGSVLKIYVRKKMKEASNENK
ncbi:MAG: sulfurtransferase TusA family protein [Nitrospira sp.]|nr:sulfurtransferase TusA family protein [Candidatus Manganitrophaceae bacterium]HIL34218.1 sulfurtransferase TusA family protein [Candidatus Manganitrophaceae bacterium]